MLYDPLTIIAVPLLVGLQPSFLQDGRRHYILFEKHARTRAIADDQWELYAVERVYPVFIERGHLRGNPPQKMDSRFSHWEKREHAEGGSQGDEDNCVRSKGIQVLLAMTPKVGLKSQSFQGGGVRV